MTRLSVNVNKVALLRNQRDIGIPSVTNAARTCMEAGANGITVHPRPDQRHIRESDVYDLAAIVDVEYNIEGNPYPYYMDIVRKVRPTQCTLVPDEAGAVTSDHGWRLEPNRERLEPIVAELKELGCRVSVFMDADSDEIPLAAEIGADRIELYTEPYATACREGRAEESIELYARAAQTAADAGLGVNAGHDLNLDNLGAFLAIGGILEVSIGHALISEALWVGLEETVRRYLEICESAGE